MFLIIVNIINVVS